MRWIPDTAYARWRLAQPVLSSRLREAECAEPPPERLLQLIWQQQRLHRHRLLLTDGRPLRVFHPGYWNREAGPDFRQAILQVGSDPPVSGDIEIDLFPQGWRQHAHAQNPRYDHVRLHVVWHPNEPIDPRSPTLALREFIDASVAELAWWLTDEAMRAVAPFVAGQCRHPLEHLPRERWRQLLREAAEVRLRAKGLALAARAREVGWNQSLFESLAAGLGYKRNAWPMRYLAELIPVLPADLPRPLPTTALLARLLGVSHLLPEIQPQTRTAAALYLRELWDCWWRDRDALSRFMLPRHAWDLSQIRPANHPHRRLALLACWIQANDMPERLEQWFTLERPRAQWLPSLLEQINPTSAHPFWTWHWNLTSRRHRIRQPLLGPQRATDLAMNSILPWLWIRAATGRAEASVRVAERLYFGWPKAEDNAVLRLARQRLFGSDPTPRLSTAAEQQGLLQIVRDFCERSNALCDRCDFPDRVRQHLE